MIDVIDVKIMSPGNGERSMQYLSCGTWGMAQMAC